jgi:hypothetical protein
MKRRKNIQVLLARSGNTECILDVTQLNGTHFNFAMHIENLQAVPNGNELPWNISDGLNEIKIAVPLFMDVGNTLQHGAILVSQ